MYCMKYILKWPQKNVIYCFLSIIMVVQNTVFLQMNSLYPTVKRGFLNGISITYKMVKVILPCYIAIEFIKHLGSPMRQWHIL